MFHRVDGQRAARREIVIVLTKCVCVCVCRAYFTFELQKASNVYFAVVPRYESRLNTHTIFARRTTTNDIISENGAYPGPLNSDVQGNGNTLQQMLQPGFWVVCTCAMTKDISVRKHYFPIA